MFAAFHDYANFNSKALCSYFHIYLLLKFNTFNFYLISSLLTDFYKD